MSQRYAHIENNKVINVLMMEDWALADYPDWQLVQSDIAGMGDDYIDGQFVSTPIPVDTNTYLHVTYPELSQVNAQIDLTVSVKFADGSPAPVQSTYYVPVIRLADNKQAAFLSVDFTDGVANVNFTPTEPGVYIMDTSKIRPVPTSIVVDHPEIIVV